MYPVDCLASTSLFPWTGEKEMKIFISCCGNVSGESLARTGSKVAVCLVRSGVTGRGSSGNRGTGCQVLKQGSSLGLHPVETAYNPREP